jgi:uncharacterized membrane protein HdeD (DUF308 family)
MTSHVFDINLQELGRNWGWHLAMGIALILLGIIALIDSVAVTVVSMMFFGWLLLFGGIIEGVQAFRHRRGNHFFLHLLNAAFAIVVGLMLLRNPLAGSLVMTLLLASYFMVAGTFRIFTALTVEIIGSGWMMADGIITLILGILVWAQWPIAGLWVIGLFIGINLITYGWSQMMLAFALRRLGKN